MRQGTTSRSVLAFLVLTLTGCIGGVPFIPIGGSTPPEDPKLAFKQLKVDHHNQIQRFVDQQNAAKPDDPIIWQDSQEQIISQEKFIGATRPPAPTREGTAPARMLSWPGPPCPSGFVRKENVLLVGVVEHDGTIGAARMFGGLLTTAALNWFREYRFEPFKRDGKPARRLFILGCVNSHFLPVD